MPREKGGGGADVVDIFSGKKIKPENDPPPSSEGDELNEEGASEQKSGEFESHLMEMVAFLQELLASERYHKKQETYEQRQELVNDATEDELRAWVNNSSKADWQKSPTFYLAVAMEIRERLQKK